MSYSFQITADSKAEAKEKITTAFDNVVNGQPPHAADRAAAIACAQAFVDLLADPHEGNEIYVTMHGSLGWHHDVPEEFSSGSISVNVSLRNKSR